MNRSTATLRPLVDKAQYMNRDGAACRSPSTAVVAGTSDWRSAHRALSADQQDGFTWRLQAPKKQSVTYGI